MKARAGVDYCDYCSVYLRRPCVSIKEAAYCPNASSLTRESCRSQLPGYSQSEADELAEYRRRFGRI